MKSEFVTIKNLVNAEIARETGLRFNLSDTTAHFKGEQFLRFSGRSQGVEFVLSFDSTKGDKIEAYLGIGDHRKDNQRFYKKINFSGTKSKKAILKDILERLEVGSINEKIAVIVAERQKNQARTELENAKTALLKKFLPNLTKYSTYYEAILDSKKNGRVRFSISECKTDLEIRSNNADFIMRICAAAAQIYDEMAQ